MQPLSRVLLPLDLSSISDVTVRLASKIFPRFDSELILLHAIEEDYISHVVSGIEIDRVLSEVRRRVKEKLKSYQDYLARNGANVKVYEDLRIGDPASVIVDVAMELSASEIFIASKGWGLRRLLPLGSTARLVIKMSKIPVIRLKAVHEDHTVKLLADEKMFDSILVALSPARQFNDYKDMLDYLASLAVKARSEVILLSVAEDREDKARSIVDMAYNYLVAEGVKRLERMVVTGKPHLRIVEVGSQMNVGCIMVKRAAVRRPSEIILGTTTSNVISRADRPVIVYP